MARTSTASIVPKGPHTGVPSAGDLDYSMTAGDAVNGNTVPWPGQRLLLLVENTDGAAAYTVGVPSVADALGRTGDITAYSLAAGDKAAFLLERAGWQQSDGSLHLDFENAAVEFAVLQLP